MTENQYEETLYALGAKNVTTDRQNSNGTTAYKLPTGQVVAEYKSGYIRRNLYQEDLPYGKCYQLNPTYSTQYKVFTLGQEFSYANKARMKILDRSERLKRLVLYTTKKLNNGTT
tara:strand:- start:274 stop:618 length:345 start_codon:yes stop_codon:yes gene_type:complete